MHAMAVSWTMCKGPGDGGGGEKGSNDWIFMWHMHMFYNFELLRWYVCTIQFLVGLYYEIEQQV